MTLYLMAIAMFAILVTISVICYQNMYDFDYEF